MKRVGNLWPQIVSWENLSEAARIAALGKRTRPDVARFLFELEPNLCRLQEELESGKYRPGPYRSFWIHDPKARMISAAAFRDRVVHHALTRVLEPVFEPRFTQYSFASRKGFGQHKALRLARTACLNYTHRATLALAGRIIDGSNRQEEVLEWFPGDELFTPIERRRGLPIGNQTSQFFANVYLNPLDQFVLRELQPGRYLRYVDDFLLFGNDRDELTAMRDRIREFLYGSRLRLHERKLKIARCADGVTFLGWRLLPGRTRLARANAVRMRRRLREMDELYHSGQIPMAAVKMRVSAWLGHAAFGDTWELRRGMFREFTLVGAEHGRGARGRVEQQFTERPRFEP